MAQRRKRSGKEALTYHPDELAALLGVARGAVYKGLRDGTIPSIRLGKRFVIPKAAVDELLRNPARVA